MREKKILKKFRKCFGCFLDGPKCFCNVCLSVCDYIPRLCNYEFFANSKITMRTAIGRVVHDRKKSIKNRKMVRLTSNWAQRFVCCMSKRVQPFSAFV